MLTKEQLHILQHSLGVDEYGRGDMYRNRYVCDPNAEMDALVALGMMMDRGGQPIAGGMHCYQVTDAGKIAMRRESPRPPKLTRSQLRYRAFLNADIGCTFFEYLKLYCGKDRRDQVEREGL